MKKLNLVVLLCAGFAVASSFYLWSALDKREQQANREKQEHQHAHLEGAGQGALKGTHETDGTRKNLASNVLANPWDKVQAGAAVEGSVATTDRANQTKPELMPEPEKEVVSPEELARRQKMQALGYMVPTDYYSKDLKTLRQLAKAGDAYAMVHLGEKYAFELNGQTTNPEFEQGMDYVKAAKQSFKDALVAGNIRSAGIIAELYFQEKNVTEAYAWHLVSDQLGDDISANWFKRTDMAQQVTPQIKQAAQARAGQIMSELKLSKKSG